MTAFAARACAGVVMASVCGVSSAASAAPESGPRADSVELGARGLVRLPIGAVEQGTKASDLTYGGLGLSLDAGWALTDRLVLGAFGSYGVTVPKLCAQAADCPKSLGEDSQLGGFLRVHPPLFWRLRPDVESGLSYVWSSRTLTDRDAKSVRTFEGASWRVALLPTLPLPRGVEVSFVIGIDVGPTHRVSLDAPGLRESRVPDGHGIRGTLDLGGRLGLRL